MGLIVTPDLQEIREGKAALVYDAKTGNSLILKEDALFIMDLLKAGKQTEDIKLSYSSKQLDALIETLYEKKLLREQNWKSEPEAKPEPEIVESGNLLQHLRLNVTESCNLDCSYCYERMSNVWAKKRTMTWEIAKKAIDLFFENAVKHKMPYVSVRFFGGEPLLNWPLVAKSIEYIEGKELTDLEIDYIINTNGTLLNDKFCQFLSAHEVAISLSLDGIEEYHDQSRKYKDGRGSFSVVEKNIQYLVKHQCSFNVSVVCSDSTLPNLTKLIEYIDQKQKELDYNIPVCFNFIQIVDKEQGNMLSVEKKVQYLIQALEKAKDLGVFAFGGLSHFVFEKLLYSNVGEYCAGRGREFSVDPEGTIFPCSGLDIRLGDIHYFKEVFAGEEYKKLIQKERASDCEGCEIEGFCAGGCFADSLKAENDPQRKEEACRLQKTVFQELVKYYLLH